jgi:type II secretory pathway pseudopilin PulG
MLTLMDYSQFMPKQRPKQPPPPPWYSPKRLRGRFSKWEFLLALVIIGVAAAIFIPQLGSAHSEESREDASIKQLQELRAYIDTYKLEHKNALPNLIQYDWKPLTQKTDSDGNASASTDGFGPYFELPPVNPFNQLSNIHEGDGLSPAPTDCGFIYDYQEGKGTGQLWLTGADKRTKTTL